MVWFSSAVPVYGSLDKHNHVTFYGPRYHGGEMHLDFEDPDGHLLEYWSRASFETP